MNMNKVAHSFKTTVRKLLCLLVLVVVSLSILGGNFQKAYAYNPQVIRSLLDTTYWYDPTINNCGVTTASTSSSGPVFLLGDSVTSGLPDFDGAKTQIESAFETSQIPITVNAKPGRYIKAWDPDGLNPKQSRIPGGLDAIAEDPTIKSAAKIIIQLGTNQGKSGGGWPDAATFTADVSAMINAVRALNSTAEIYWINIAVNTPRTSDLPLWSERNRIISEQSSVNNFSVIDWFDVAFPGKDPFNIPNVVSPMLNLIHASDAGKSALADLLVDAVSGDSNAANASASNANLSSPTCCRAANGASALIGGDNKEKIWNFLIGKGLTPPQAAGVMGNMQAESGFNPKRVQNTPTPEGDKDNITVDGKTGYGISQWTTVGRQKGLENAAKTAGTPSGDLGTQLQYLFDESNQRALDRKPPHPTYIDTSLKEWKGLTTTLNVRDATIFWHWNNERSGDNAARVEGRVQFATDILAQFGSTSGGVSSVSASNVLCVNGAGGPFSYGRYASLSRQQLIDIILKAPNWKPQSQDPVNDITSGVAVDNLLRLLAGLIESLPTEQITPSVIQTGHSCLSASGNISNHMGGLAVDLGGSGHSPQSMNTIFTWLYNNNAALGINELIFEPVPAGTSTLKHGAPLVYKLGTREDHRDHIHVSVKGPIPTTCPGAV
ncbi:MAG TPA: phage tail tip lysozyme [Candidatus Saccharimonadales bacterium]|nr:phage tail tip lysozyme [Candidatus Saccharimonadales bacterium]